MRDFLTAPEMVILREKHHDTRFRKQADRIKTILFLNAGYSYAETAKLLLIDDTTARRYYKEFKKSGVDGLLENNYAGSESFLSKSAEQELITHLREHTYPTVTGVIDYVYDKYQVKYSIEGMTHLLHRLKFSYHKMKQAPGKLDPEKQAIFKQEYAALKEKKQPADKIYFVDASHPQHNSKPSYGWIYQGGEKYIRANTGRRRININGALNLEDLTILTRLEETINAEAMINLIKYIESNQPEGEIYLILDNARYNHANVVKEYVQQSKRIHLVFLPAYSPNLNIIERLWLFFHQKILYNNYYETFDEFKTVCLNFFNQIDKYKEELRSRLTDNFQTISV